MVTHDDDLARADALGSSTWLDGADHGRTDTEPGAGTTGATPRAMTRSGHCDACTRWRKVLRDLGAHPMRIVLVVLSIAVGVFAVGTMRARTRCSANLTESYATSLPASAPSSPSPSTPSSRQRPRSPDVAGERAVAG